MNLYKLFFCFYVKCGINVYFCTHKNASHFILCTYRFYTCEYLMRKLLAINDLALRFFLYLSFVCSILRNSLAIIFTNYFFTLYLIFIYGQWHLGIYGSGQRVVSSVPDQFSEKFVLNSTPPFFVTRTTYIPVIIILFHILDFIFQNTRQFILILINSIWCYCVDALINKVNLLVRFYLILTSTEKSGQFWSAVKPT